ncbi:MAG: hypothetical protein FWG63_07190 [Defluviitaleaceae bacterium]|nr:hypothetical protein [Defluviitaleaceae bacterium]
MTSNKYFLKENQALILDYIIVKREKEEEVVYYTSVANTPIPRSIYFHTGGEIHTAPKFVLPSELKFLKEVFNG